MTTTTTTSKFPYIFSIDGIIGSGKTTLLETVLAIAKKQGMRPFVVHEPVDEWIKSGIFQKYCDNPKEHAFAFQVQVTVSRITTMTNAINEFLAHPGRYDFIIGERLCRGSDFVFADAQHKIGNISDTEWSSYCSLYFGWSTNPVFANQTPTIVYYVTTPVDICLANIAARNRGGESGISREYLNLLRLNHDIQLDEAVVHSPVRPIVWCDDKWERTAPEIVAHIRDVAVTNKAKVERLYSLYPQRVVELNTRRNQCITGSMVDIINGDTVFNISVADLFREKTIGKRWQQSEATAYGTRYEPVAREKFIAKTGARYYEYDLIFDEQYKWLAASVDGMAIMKDGEEVIIEIKCPHSRPITDEFPMHYYGQIQLYMRVTGLRSCKFVQFRPAYIKGRPNPAKPTSIVRVPKDEQLTILTIPYDEEWVATYLPLWFSFWKKIMHWRKHEEGIVRRAARVISELWKAHCQHRPYCSPSWKSSALRYTKQYHDDIALAKTQAPPVTFGASWVCPIKRMTEDDENMCPPKRFRAH